MYVQVHFHQRRGGVHGAAVPAAREAPRTLDDAWQRALDAWDDAALHDKLLELATTHDGYAWLAARYRERIEANPADAAVAKARLERLQKVIVARLMMSAAQRPDHEARPYRATIAMLGILILALLGSSVYAAVRSSTKGAQIHTITPAPEEPR
jgi:hypothetical protein